MQVFLTDAASPDQLPGAAALRSAREAAALSRLRQLTGGIVAAGAVMAAALPAGATAPWPAQPPAAQAAQSRLAYQRAQQDLQAAQAAVA
jgi:hypothetical protein